MGNLAVINDNPKSQDSHMMSTIACIRTISAKNLTHRCRITKGYAALAAKVEELKELKVDKELAEKVQNSQKIKWDHRTVTKQLTKLQKQAQKDPELVPQELTAYKLEHQEVARSKGRLPQNPDTPFEPNDPLEYQEANALHIPMHACTKLGTHVLPVLVDTGVTQNFLSYDAAEKLGLTWKEDDIPKPVVNADRSKCGTGMITLYCDILMKLDNLWKEERFYKAETRTDQVVLGIPWLMNFKPTINWTKGTVTEVLEVPLYVPTCKVKKKISWEDKSAKPTPSSVKEEELNSQINRDREKEDTPWSGGHCPSPGIRPGGDQSKQPDNMLGDKNTPTDLAMLQIMLKAKQAQCNDPLE